MAGRNDGYAVRVPAVRRRVLTPTTRIVVTKSPSMFRNARIPYGTWGSSYFPAWQTSALAEVNIGQFAGESMAKILSLRNVPQSALEYLVIGSTVP